MMNVKQNELKELMEIDCPIIQGPFGGGISSIELLAIVSNLGGLGSFGAHYLAPERIIALIHDIRKETERSFNINLWVSNFDEDGRHLEQQKYEALCEDFKPYYDELSIALPVFPNDLYHSFEEQAEAIIEARPKVFSFVYGVPSTDIIERCKERGIITLGTATTLNEAIALEDGGVDAVVVTGFEAGGHRVSFLKEAEDSLTGTLALIPQVVDRIKIPIITAGGIADARGIRAASELGASGVQVGTAFLACDESGTSMTHREALFAEAARETILSRAYTGRLARFIPDKFIQDMANHDDLPSPFPIQSFFVKALKEEALKTGNMDYLPMYSSQSAPLLKHRKAKTLFEDLAMAFQN